MSVSEKFPRFVEAGEMPVSVGVGFQRVTAAEADLVVFAALVAVTLTVLGEGRVPGAVYLPVESMVPRAALPPAVEFTDQATAVFVESETAAVKEYVEPARMLAVEGETDTETEAGFDWVGEGVWLAVFDAAPQEASAIVASNTSKNRNTGRSPVDIVRIVSKGADSRATGRRYKKGEMDVFRGTETLAPGNAYWSYRSAAQRAKFTARRGPGG
jgi:hypothetical protein